VKVSLKLALVGLALTLGFWLAQATRYQYFSGGDDRVDRWTGARETYAYGGWMEPGEVMRRRQAETDALSVPGP
jgi:hypothetical protein